MIHDTYDFTGTLIKSNIVPDVDELSKDLIVTNDNTDYFVTGRKLFSKKDLSEIDILNEFYLDLAISADGLNLYGLHEADQQIHVINFVTKRFERVIELEDPAIRIFLDGNMLIVVHPFITTSGFSGEKSIYISKIPI